ncbi:hypothetical protein GTA51_15665 [Desulfovibrio aerotolerans]|uniref:Uncharacterized protein n=1 Tax=Solidesulfovibrio aerotolerans TaxID=295255 RepID=A0A7C9JAS6_9BACT|nr:hypothetical protein [Solidesulfovibrio aerotolerans]
MEQVLLKMARQLRAFDEASLMALWDKYSETVSRFEPSQRWEEAVLVLAMIQGMRFKNQLFNHHWAEGQQPGQPATPAPILATPLGDAMETSGKKAGPKRQNKGKVLAFRPKD